MTTRITADHVKLKRAYEPAAANDGARILIDRLWPRGVKKADAAIDQWAKDIAPSTALRKWFGQDSARWAEFHRRYAAEVPPASRTAQQITGPGKTRPDHARVSRLMTMSITTLLRYGIFFWDDKQSERPRRLIDSGLEESDAHDGLA